MKVQIEPNKDAVICSSHCVKCGTRLSKRRYGKYCKKCNRLYQEGQP